MSLNLPEVVLVPIEDASTVYMQCISPKEAFLRIPRCVWNAPSPPPATASTRPPRAEGASLDDSRECGGSGHGCLGTLEVRGRRFFGIDSAAAKRFLALAGKIVTMPGAAAFTLAAMRSRCSRTRDHLVVPVKTTSAILRPVKFCWQRIPWFVVNNRSTEASSAAFNKVPFVPSSPLCFDGAVGAKRPGNTSPSSVVKENEHRRPYLRSAPL